MALTKINNNTLSAITGLPAGVGGKVLQVVHANTSTQVSSSSSTLADTTLTASITPSATSSKVLVIATHNSNYVSTGNTNHALRLVLLRGSTQIGRTGAVNWDGVNQAGITSSASFNVVDSPSSTSALTYKTQFANISNLASAVVQNSFGGDWVTTSYITLIEIGA